ncbi:hypothetical protein EUGRSUZ_G01816 [Eucalyptus grandis]|uniref:Uncharacterized protein n=2 Tax=Eucalyptus grandis TaxID=71139 RepID=A0ACC3K5B5_EUCGR|nr:hypothetical protein EUGRSUZ_G01816 [Eucalyptus grandis]
MSPKKLIKMARTWEKLTALGRRNFPSWKKGHFVIYMTDGGRSTIPLQSLHSNIFEELLKMSEEEFGLSGDGPITVPCDAASMEYIVSLVQRCVAKDIEKALLNSIAFTLCSMAAAVHSRCVDQQAVFLGK